MYRDMKFISRGLPGRCVTEFVRLRRRSHGIVQDVNTYLRLACLCVFVCCSYFPVFYVMPSSECGANLSKTLPKSGIQIGKSDQRHTSAVAKINIQPFFAFTQTLSLNSFIFLTREGDFQEPTKSVPFSFSLFPSKISFVLTIGFMTCVEYLFPIQVSYVSSFQVTPLVWIFMAIISVLVLLIILIGLILRARCSQVDIVLS